MAVIRRGSARRARLTGDSDNDSDSPTDRSTTCVWAQRSGQLHVRGFGLMRWPDHAAGLRTAVDDGGEKRLVPDSLIASNRSHLEAVPCRQAKTKMDGATEYLLPAVALSILRTT